MQWVKFIVLILSDGDGRRFYWLANKPSSASGSGFALCATSLRRRNAINETTCGAIIFIMIFPTKDTVTSVNDIIQICCTLFAPNWLKCSFGSLNFTIATAIVIGQRRFRPKGGGAGMLLWLVPKPLSQSPSSCNILAPLFVHSNHYIFIALKLGCCCCFCSYWL